MAVRIYLQNGVRTYVCDGVVDIIYRADCN